MTQHTLVWIRGKDLRLSDHAPLLSALEGEKVTLLFVVDPFFFASHRAAQLPHRMQFLLQSLEALENNIRSKGGELLFVEGKSVDVIPICAERLGVTRVVAHRWSEPFGRKRDERIGRRLSVPFDLFGGETLLPPESVRTGSASPYAVFTPFSRACRELLHQVLEPPRRAPSRLPPLEDQPRLLGDLIRRRPTFSEIGIVENSQLTPGGEKAARRRLNRFLEQRLAAYDEGRDLLGEEGTSRLSQDLKFGTLSVREVWTRVAEQPVSAGRDRFATELLWREFAYATMWDRPSVLSEPFRVKFRDFPYDGTEQAYQAWAEGQTGIPIVDAASRQLLREGFIHNRARMISASFLTKNLMISYTRGEAHYMKYLTDGDWAQNNMGWQWSAGCGVDAAPYFRVFNPVTQGKKFDAEGRYVKKYVPELSRLPVRYLHQPWKAPRQVLDEAGVVLGENYPRPIVDLSESRKRFLAAASGR